MHFLLQCDIKNRCDRMVRNVQTVGQLDDVPDIPCKYNSIHVFVDCFPCILGHNVPGHVECGVRYV